MNRKLDVRGVCDSARAREVVFGLLAARTSCGPFDHVTGGRPVLVVDDHPDAAETICMLLRTIGHECVMATTGREGLELAEKYQVDIALLDIGLPDISGYEIARRLRAVRGRQIFIAAITGWGEPSDRTCAFEAGFDRHVQKPASSTVIREVLSAAEAYLEHLGGEL